MIRNTLLVLALAAAPALAQQPTQQPVSPKPAGTVAAQHADTAKAKAHRARRVSRSKPKPAAPRDSTSKP